MRTLWLVIQAEDQSAPESLHIYPVKEGLSQKPVDPDAVPVFDEQISYRSVLTQVMLLVLFNLLFFIIALVSLLKIKRNLLLTQNSPNNYCQNSSENFKLKKVQLFCDSFVVTITSFFNSKFWLANCVKRADLKSDLK